MVYDIYFDSIPTKPTINHGRLHLNLPWQILATCKAVHNEARHRLMRLHLNLEEVVYRKQILTIPKQIRSHVEKISMDLENYHGRGLSVIREFDQLKELSVEVASIRIPVQKKVHNKSSHIIPLIITSLLDGQPPGTKFKISDVEYMSVFYSWIHWRRISKMWNDVHKAMLLGEGFKILVRATIGCKANGIYGMFKITFDPSGGTWRHGW